MMGRTLQLDRNRAKLVVSEQSRESTKERAEMKDLWEELPTIRCAQLKIFFFKLGQPRLSARVGNIIQGLPEGSFLF